LIPLKAINPSELPDRWYKNFVQLSGYEGQGREGTVLLRDTLNDLQQLKSHFKVYVKKEISIMMENLLEY
jgi:hypothetical protein